MRERKRPFSEERFNATTYVFSICLVYLFIECSKTHDLGEWKIKTTHVLGEYLVFLNFKERW